MTVRLSFGQLLTIVGRASFRLEPIALIVGERLVRRTAAFDHPLKIGSESTRLRGQLTQLCTDFFLWWQKFHPLSYKITSLGH